MAYGGQVTMRHLCARIECGAVLATFSRCRHVCPIWGSFRNQQTMTLLHNFLHPMRLILGLDCRGQLPIIGRTPLQDFPQARAYPCVLGRDGLVQDRTSPDLVFRVRSCKRASRLACSAQARTRSPRPRTRRACPRPDGPASIFESGLFGDARNMPSESGRFAGLEH